MAQPKISGRVLANIPSGQLPMPKKRTKNHKAMKMADRVIDVHNKKGC
jgi:hypothetical protein